MPSAFISSMILMPLEVPSRVAPASIMAFAAAQLRMPPAAFTCTSPPAYRFIQVEKTHEPDPAAVAAYAPVKELFEACYQAMLPVYEKMARR